MLALLLCRLVAPSHTCYMGLSFLLPVVQLWEDLARDHDLHHRRKKETWLDLLRCLSSQPQAAAQATAVSLGAYHTVALMAQNQADPADLQLMAFGRGEHT